MTDPTRACGLAAREVPGDMLIACPLHQSLLRIARACDGCRHFEGIAKLNDDTRFGWEQRHLVLCGYRRKLPVQRLGAARPATIGGGLKIAG